LILLYRIEFDQARQGKISGSRNGIALNFPAQSVTALRFLILFCFLSVNVFSQTLGGNAAYQFLKLPASPLATAAGGVNVSYKTKEVSLAALNPALLSPDLSSQLNASFNAFLGGVNTYSLTGAHHVKKWNTTLAGHIYFVDYGSIPVTDAAGNSNGDFRPRDYVIQLSAARKYLERWTYGATVKWIQSSYQQYRSSAAAVDFGVLYHDSARNFSASFVAKNMGFQVSSFANEKEELPFDLQVGITKRLAKAPFGFSLTAQHLHRLNIQYNDTVFNNENRLRSPSSFNRIFNHFILATHIYLGQTLEATIGYNHLRRSELTVQNAPNGLTGFSAGLRLKFNKLQIVYARSSYQRGISFNQIGITAQLDQFGGLGK